MSRKLTNNEFIERSTLVHNNYYDYSKTYYINNRKNVLIICPIHGEFYKNAAQHLNGKGCNECNYIDRLTSYKSKKLHRPRKYGKKGYSIKKLAHQRNLLRKENNDKKLYNNILKNNLILLSFKSTNKKLLVEDNLGIKYLVRRADLLKGCYPKITSAVDKTQAFAIKLKLVHPSLTLLNEYINNKSKILVKDSLDIIYSVIPSDLLAGRFPIIQSALNKNECFIKKANLIHKNKYGYDKVDYINASTKILIYCKEHDKYFLQLPYAHLNGQGCPKCVTTTGYSKKQFVEYCTQYNKFICTLYIIRCFNDNEEFIKIGITARNTAKRFAYHQIPYSFEILKEIKGSPDFIWDKEKELHNLCKKHLYNPLLNFGGYTECFSLNCKKLIEKYL